MKHFYRLFVCGCAAAVFTVLFVFVLTRLGGAQAQDSLDLMMWLRTWADAMQEHEELRARGVPVFRRTVEKNHIVRELLAHHLTMREATDRFRELDEDVRQAQPDLPTAIPESADDAAASRSVLLWVRSELAAKPDEAEKVVSELEREMCEDRAAPH